MPFGADGIFHGAVRFAIPFRGRKLRHRRARVGNAHPSDRVGPTVYPPLQVPNAERTGRSANSSQ